MASDLTGTQSSDFRPVLVPGPCSWEGPFFFWPQFLFSSPEGKGLLAPLAQETSFPEPRESLPQEGGLWSPPGLLRVNCPPRGRNALARPAKAPVRTAFALTPTPPASPSGPTALSRGPQAGWRSHEGLAGSGL